jgi:hypothetical protein
MEKSFMSTQQHPSCMVGLYLDADWVGVRLNQFSHQHTMLDGWMDGWTEKDLSMDSNPLPNHHI